MYSAKEKGNNAVCMYRRDIIKKNNKTISVEQDLPKALENNEFVFIISTTS